MMAHTDKQEAAGTVRKTSTRETLRTMLEEVRHWLPTQGPIGVFIHHNTLHSLEHLRFEQAVEHAGEVLGAQPYLTHTAFLGLMREGRILPNAIDRALQNFLQAEAEPKIRLGSLSLNRREVYRYLLEIPFTQDPSAALEWRVEQQSAKDEGRSQALWQEWRRGLFWQEVLPPSIEIDHALNERVADLASHFLDQNVSHCPMPLRESGFLNACRSLFPKQIPPGDALELIERELTARSLAPGQYQSFLLREALQLRGWAGTFSVLEARADLLPELRFPCSLAEFLAVRLCLGSKEVPPATESVTIGTPTLSAVFNAWELLNTLLVKPEDMAKWSTVDKRELLDEISKFSDVLRRRVLQQAYEASSREIFLGSLLANAELNRSLAFGPTEVKVITCIDEREESFRRHLEEVDAGIGTLAIAGFFGVDMIYQGIEESRQSSLCPVILTPRIAIEETHLNSDHGQTRLKQLGFWRRQRMIFHDSSRSLWGGVLVHNLLGVTSFLSLAGHVLSPRLAAKLRRHLASASLQEAHTELRLEREGDTRTPHGYLAGFSTTEMADRVENFLKAIGLLKDFGKLILVLGHGSTSQNNPHESAYDCGACGGRRGGPNARAFAQMANSPKVRAELARRGITLPDDTVFLGGYHDTCSDAVVYFDLLKLPPSHSAIFRETKARIDEARQRDAHERSRRFEKARDLTESEALTHVEVRSRDLREARPEYCHASNAITIVGRRELSKYLYLDRRAFLSSYDAKVDPTGSILAGILGAVIPVCAGISLEYYFSYVDNEVYGCGTKLPHNVTAGIGVMTGRVSDLRTGLSRQMVEIHEPLRPLFIVEAEIEKVQRVVDNHAGIGRLVHNHWVQLAVIDPQTLETKIFDGHQVVPYQRPRLELKRVARSRDYYEGHLEHLHPVRVQKESK